MASVLMKEPCGSPCEEEVEYRVTFKVNSLEMLDVDCDEKFKNILLVVTWDSNVFKVEKIGGDEDVFDEKVQITIHTSPESFSKKLKTCPFMVDLSRGCTELGTVKLPLTDCFCDAVLCSDFNMQTVTNEFSFVNDDEENATMEAFLQIEKLASDELSDTLFKSLQSKLSTKKSSKKPKQKKAGKKKGKSEKSRAGDDGSDDDSESDSESEEGSCKDFVCPEDLPEHCKNLGLNEHVYRVINGHLINTKNKIGPCGEKCPVAKKYIKELKNSENVESLPLSSKFQLDNQPKCQELFESFQCPCKKQGKCQRKDCGNSSKKSCKDAWIDRNIKEEDLLKKLCEKHGINVDDIKAVGTEPVDVKKCKKLKKKRKSKKVRDCEKLICNLEGSKSMPPTQEKFIKKMKRKARGKYCYDFGNSVVSLESLNFNKVEQGAGDCSTVPKYMGWRWDEPIVGLNGKKWYPGQINKTVRCLMKHALNPFPYDTLPLTRRDKTGRVVKTCTKFPNWEKIDLESYQKPTLKISKKDGELEITMHPLKDKEKLETDCIPFLNCAPLKFKLKQHPEEIKKHRAKKILRQKGFTKKCPCDDIKYCRCISETTKKLLSYELKNASEGVNLVQPLKYSDLYESSDSELDLQFTTPSGIVDPKKCKPNVTHCGTQYLFTDFIKPKSPKCFKVAESCKEKALATKLSNPKAPTKKLTKKKSPRV